MCVFLTIPDHIHLELVFFIRFMDEEQGYNMLSHSLQDPHY